MGRKERRKQRRLNEKEARAEYKKIYLTELNKMRKNILKDYCDRYVQLSIAATLLAIKDERGLSENMAKRILSRINSILSEFNHGSHSRLNEILEVVKDELNINLKEI